jgi:hypothetical protein
VGLLRRTEYGIGRKVDDGRTVRPIRDQEKCWKSLLREFGLTPSVLHFTTTHFRVSIRRAAQIQDANASVMVKIKCFLRVGIHLRITACSMFSGTVLIINMPDKIKIRGQRTLLLGIICGVEQDRQ